MLLSYLVLAQLVTLSTANMWNVPTYVKFSINKYMNSSCSTKNHNETDLMVYCRDSQSSNGIPSCCYDQLEKLSPFEHTKFNTCYNVTTDNETSYFNYKCDSEKINEISILQAFGVIGGVCIVILVFILFTTIFSYICGCSEKRRYKSIN